MSVFTSRVTDTVEVPGLVVTVRKLAPRHLHAAEQANSFEAIKHFKALGGAAFMKDLKQLMSGEAGAGADDGTAKGDVIAQAAAAHAKDPMNGFDRQVLLEKGIVSWQGEDAPALSPEAIEDLDDDAQLAIATRILKLSKPSLYRTDEEQEAVRKNG